MHAVFITNLTGLSGGSLSRAGFGMVSSIFEFAESRWDSDSESNWFYPGDELSSLCLEKLSVADVFSENMFFLSLQYSIQFELFV